MYKQKTNNTVNTYNLQKFVEVRGEDFNRRNLFRGLKYLLEQEIVDKELVELCIEDNSVSKEKIKEMRNLILYKFFEKI